ncbi:unnamed protein product [Prunus brigantina]
MSLRYIRTMGVRIADQVDQMSPESSEDYRSGRGNFFGKCSVYRGDSAEFLNFQMAVKNPISSILNNYILDGTNYPGWLRKVKLVLKMDEIDYVLTHAPPHIHPDEEASREERTAYEKHMKDDSRGKCYLLASMNDELLKQHEDMDDCASILLHLKELYGEATRSLRYNTICELVNTKMTRGTPMESSLSELLNMAMVAEKNILKDKGMKGTVAVFEKGSSSSSKSKPKGWTLEEELQGLPCKLKEQAFGR